MFCIHFLSFSFAIFDDSDYGDDDRCCHISLLLRRRLGRAYHLFVTPRSARDRFRVAARTVTSTINADEKCSIRPSNSFFRCFVNAKGNDFYCILFSLSGQLRTSAYSLKHLTYYCTMHATMNVLISLFLRLRDTIYSYINRIEKNRQRTTTEMKKTKPKVEYKMNVFGCLFTFCGVFSLRQRSTTEK